jgi:hypothetical protein
MIAIMVLGLCTWFNWRTLKTDDFTVIYKEDYYWEALNALHDLEYYKNDVQEIIGGRPGNLPIVIEDVGAESNGFANPIFNNVHIFTSAPGFNYRIEGIENWYRTVTVHEYAHIVHLSKTRGLSRTFTDVFGSIFAPNIYSPGWIIEGITVFSESQTTPYEGRLNDGFFDSYIGARVHSHALPSIVEATNTPMDFPFGTYYLYGGEFFDFLAQRYGLDKFAVFFNEYGGYFWAPMSAVFPFTGLDIAARHTYGKSFPVLFREWQQYEKSRQEDWEPAGTRVTERGWYVYSLEQDNGKLYYVRFLPFKVDGFTQRSLTCIAEFDPLCEREKIVAVLSGTICAPLRIADGTLYYATHELARGYANVYYGGFGITANLHKRDLVTGVDRILFTDDIRAFCVLPDSSILYSKDRSHGYGSELWLFDDSNNVMLFETDLLIGELDANDKYVVAVGRRDFENWNIFLLDYRKQEFRSVIATPWIEGSVNIVADALLFTANYDGVYGIYWHELLSGRIYRLTHGGYADNGAVVGQTLYFKGMSQQGFDIYMTGFDPEEFSIAQTAPSIKPEFAAVDLKTSKGGYLDVLKTLAPSVRVPFLLPSKSDFSTWIYGLFLLGGDATDENLYAGFLARETSEDDLIINLLWQSRFFYPLDVYFFYDYKNLFEYSISFPAFASLEYGVSSFNLFLDGRVFDGLTRVEFSPGCGISFHYPYTDVSAVIALPFERQAWGSDINRSAQKIYVGLQQFLAGGEVRFSGQGYVDRHDPDVPEFSIRGYEAIESQRALVVSTEYVHRLCKLRKGLWNPNVYFEDLYWTVFADYALDDKGTAYYSLGCELKLEAKAGFGFIQLVPKIGIALTEAGQVKIFFGITPQLPI